MCWISSYSIGENACVAHLYLARRLIFKRLHMKLLIDYSFTILLLLLVILDLFKIVCANDWIVHRICCVKIASHAHRHREGESINLGKGSSRILSDKDLPGTRWFHPGHFSIKVYSIQGGYMNLASPSWILNESGIYRFLVRLEALVSYSKIVTPWKFLS